MPVGKAAAFVLAVAAASQQTTVTPPEPAVTASVMVRFPAGKTTYQIGEEIPLELEFRGKAGPDFYFSTASYDRSGRMSQEQYAITPVRGFVDPLAEYYASAVTIGGGLSSSQ